MGSTWKQSVQIAFTYIGTVVGAGFASGREIVEFFVQYGFQGFVGILVAALLFVWAGVRVMIVAFRLKANSYQEMNNYLFGRVVGPLFNLILLAVLLGTSAVMLAAIGTLFHGSFHLPAQAGIWLSMVWIYLVTRRGLAAIHSVNSLFVPTLIGFTLLIFFYSEPWHADTANQMIVEPGNPWTWLRSPLAYAALNVSLAQAVLVPIGRESRSERPLILGGMLGGLGIGLLLLLAYWSMSVHMPAVVTADMPMIYILTGLGRGVALLFALLVFAEIFSTLVANVFGIVQQLKQWISLPPTLLILVILAVCYLISLVGFPSLLSILYPFFGQIVFLFLFMLAYRQISEVGTGKR